MTDEYIATELYAAEEAMESAIGHIKEAFMGDIPPIDFVNLIEEINELRRKIDKLTTPYETWIDADQEYEQWRDRHDD